MRAPAKPMATTPALPPREGPHQRDAHGQREPRARPDYAPTPLRLTTLGGMVLFEALALLTTRWWLPLPYTMPLGASLLLALMLGAWLAPARLKRVRGGWLLPGPVHAGEECTVGALLSADAGAPPITLEAVNPVTGKRDQVVRLKSLAGRDLKPTWSVRFPRRGPMTLPPLVARCEQPFGVWSAAAPIGEAAELIVLPALGTVTTQLRVRLRTYSAQHATTVDSGDDELAQLRPYRPGDAPRAVHWRASARHRELLVAERHALGCRRLALVLDTAVSGDLRKLERLVSAAATIVDHLLAEGWHVTLHGSFAPTGLHARRAALLEALALVSADARAVGEYVPFGTPALVLAAGSVRIERGAPAPLVILPAELELLVTLPRRLR